MKRCFNVRLLSFAMTSFWLVAQAQTPVNLGTIQVSQIGHVFQTNQAPFPNLIFDYFIDQGQKSGGGSMLPPVTVDWSTNHEFTVTISPPPGDMFLIQPPGLLSGKFSGSLWWTNGAPFGPSVLGAVNVSLVTLQGAPPDFSQSFCTMSDSQTVFGFGTIDSAPFVKEIAFTSMVITGTLAPQTGTGGAMAFAADPASQLAFVSVGPSGDPGPCVSIVPFAYRAQAPFEVVPSLNFTADQAGDFVATFNGTLQWSPNLRGPFSDVPGHPLGAFAVSKNGLFPQLFFRVRYNH